MVPSFRIILWTVNLFLAMLALADWRAQRLAILASFLATGVLILWEGQRAEIQRVRRALAATLKLAEEAAGKLAHYQARAAVAEALAKAPAVVWAGTPEAYLAKLEAEGAPLPEWLERVEETGDRKAVYRREERREAQADRALDLAEKPERKA